MTVSRAQEVLRACGVELKTDEPVVTPEMIEAVRTHVLRYHPEPGVDADDSVRRIYEAMTRARDGGEQ